MNRACVAVWLWENIAKVTYLHISYLAQENVVSRGGGGGGGGGGAGAAGAGGGGRGGGGGREPDKFYRYHEYQQYMKQDRQQKQKECVVYLDIIYIRGVFTYLKSRATFMYMNNCGYIQVQPYGASPITRGPLFIDWL